MNRMLSFFLCLFLLGYEGHGQKKDRGLIDSLLAALSTASDDTTRLNLYAELFYAHVNYKPKEGLAYQQKALDLAQKANWLPGTARVKNRLGRIYWRLGNFDEALRLHFDALDIYKSGGDKIGEGRILLAIGQDFLDAGKYTEANDYLLKAIQVTKANGDKYFLADTYAILNYLYSIQGDIPKATEAAYAYLKSMEEIGTKSEIAMAAVTLGQNYLELGNYEEALKYFKISLQGAKDQGMIIEVVSYSITIGDMCALMGKYPEAMSYYTSVLKLAQETMDDKLLAQIHHGLGNLYILLGKYPEALHNLQLAEVEFIAVGNKNGLADVNTKLGIVYTYLNRFDQARNYFRQAKQLFDGLNSKLSMEDYYSGMELLNQETGNWKGAYDAYKQYVMIKDSAFNKGTVQKLVASQIQYEADKKAAQVKAAQERKDLIAKGAINRQRNIRNVAFFILGLVLLFSVVVYRQRNKIALEKKRSDLLLADKELLLREIHHRVKNNLEVVSSLLALQSAQVDDLNTRELMQEGQNRVHSISIVHQKLYQGENLGAIEMKDYFINLSESILDSFGANKKVQIECAMEALNIDIDTAVPLGLIVNELLTNTLKYAFPDGRDGKVQIKLEKRKDGVLQLQVSDNGIGKSGRIQGTGFGGQLVSLLTKQLSGSMREENNNGTNIVFEFKMEVAA